MIFTYTATGKLSVVERLLYSISNFIQPDAYTLCYSNKSKEASIKLNANSKNLPTKTFLEKCPPEIEVTVTYNFGGTQIILHKEKDARQFNRKDYEWFSEYLDKVNSLENKIEDEIGDYEDLEAYEERLYGKGN